MKDALARLGFVQADPIRAPACAQDLILRHRVKNYRAGELERRYPSLDIEEDYLYAYGFVARPLYRLLHPRGTGALSALERKIIAAVRDSGELHPGQAAARFGHNRITNAWGGQSRRTTDALERLHHRGLLRVVRRQGGTRIYAPAGHQGKPEPAGERCRKLILAAAAILAPAPRKSFQSAIAPRLRWILPSIRARELLDGMIGSGELQSRAVDGIEYVWPSGKINDEEPPRRVRLLAPFDPLVWDRRRFEHLWGWAYRFEAYTPPAKRLRGYYAMPLLWGDDIIGWANAAVRGGRLECETGFAGKRPAGKDFHRELEAEFDAMKAFLSLP
ncbi:MAG: crosslink repair DNA glycosylase YcaQ family protein [Elusimicrobiales bacterium]